MANSTASLHCTFFRIFLAHCATGFCRCCWENGKPRSCRKPHFCRHFVSLYCSSNYIVRLARTTLFITTNGIYCCVLLCSSIGQKHTKKIHEYYVLARTHANFNLLFPFWFSQHFPRTLIWHFGSPIKSGENSHELYI